MERYGIIAHPVNHSLTPVMYQAGFEALGMEASCEKFDVGEDELEKFFQKFRGENMSWGDMGERDGESSDEWRGLAISSPLKEAIIPLLDRLHPIAEQIGAVNTVRVVRSHARDEKCGNGGEMPKASLVGYNTDWLGITRALEEHIVGCDSDGSRGKDGDDREIGGVSGAGGSRVKALKWKKALVIGAGGAARGAVYALKELGMHVYLVNRTDERACELARHFNIAHLDFSFVNPDSEGYPCENFDVVVNATSLGLDAHVSPLPISFWEEFGNGIALDFVYHSSGKADTPLVAEKESYTCATRFLQEADRAGWETIGGVRVLARQGVEQFSVLSGRSIDVAVFDRALNSHLNPNT